MKIDSNYIDSIANGHKHDYLAEIGNVENVEKGTGTFWPEFDLSWIDDLVQNPVVQMIIIVACALVLVVAALWLWSRYVNDDDDDVNVQGMGGDTIYGHDWDAEIEQLMRQGVYGEVVVLCYLRCLNRLNDGSIIEFHQSKTPGMFLAEARDKAGADHPLVAHLPELTHHYLDTRYGHREASQELANQLIELTR